MYLLILHSIILDNPHILTCNRVDLILLVKKTSLVVIKGMEILLVCIIFFSCKCVYHIFEILIIYLPTILHMLITHKYKNVLCSYFYSYWQQYAEQNSLKHLYMSNKLMYHLITLIWLILNTETAWEIGQYCCRRGECGFSVKT